MTTYCQLMCPRSAVVSDVSGVSHTIHCRSNADLAHCLQAKNMDGENKSIVASILGTVVLVWLAFGFSLVAMLALGVAGTIAALLARFSRWVTCHFRPLPHGWCRMRSTGISSGASAEKGPPVSRLRSEELEEQRVGMKLPWVVSLYRQVCQMSKRHGHHYQVAWVMG